MTYGMTGIMLPTGAFVSGETIMTVAMTTGYTMTGSNMLVKVNDSMAGLTGTNMMAGTMGQANYQLVKGTSAQVSNNVLELGLSNPRLYGTNNNVGNIRENATIKSNEGEEKNKHIEIYDNEGAHRNLYGIKKYNSATREENVKDAVQKLKDILEKDDFYFYITRGNKLYKKIDQCYKRVREEEIYRRK